VVKGRRKEFFTGLVDAELKKRNILLKYLGKTSR